MSLGSTKRQSSPIYQFDDFLPVSPRFYLSFLFNYVASCYKMFCLGSIMTQIKDGISFYQNRRSKIIMPISDTQIFVALIIALFPGIMAIRLSTELYK